MIKAERDFARRTPRRDVTGGDPWRNKTVLTLSMQEKNCYVTAYMEGVLNNATIRPSVRLSVLSSIPVSVCLMSLTQERYILAE